MDRHKNPRHLVIKSIFLFFSFAFLFPVFFSVAGASTIYVSPSGNDITGTGQSWTTAYRSITAGLRAAVSGDTVQADYGEYNQANGETFPIMLKDNVDIIGMEFADVQNGTANPGSMIIGNDAFLTPIFIGQRQVDGIPQVDGTPVSRFRIEGFTISHGGGGAILLDSCVDTDPLNKPNTIARCRLTNNFGTGPSGIAVFNHSSVRIENCLIDNNVMITLNPLFPPLGAGVMIDQDSTGSLVNSTIIDNQIQVLDASASHGAGVYSASFTAAVFNCVIWHNTISSPSLVNPLNEDYWCAGIPNPPASCILTNYSYGGSGNFSNNPHAYSYDLYRPQPDSVAVDGGRYSYMTAAAPATDILGAPRPQGATYDIGAFETGDGEAPTGSLGINGGGLEANTPYVDLNPLASDSGGSGLFRMRFSNGGGYWSPWRDYDTFRPRWSLIDPLYGGVSGNGDKTVFVQYKDHAGNVSPTYSQTITLNQPALFSINDGEAITSSLIVSLNLPLPVYPDDMRFSNDPMALVSPELAEWCPWDTFSPIRFDWDLSSYNGSAADGPKRVYAQFRTGGIVDPILYFDDIILDTLPPFGATLNINGGAGYTRFSSVNLTESAMDDNTVASMSFSNDGVHWSLWKPYALSFEGWDLVGDAGGTLGDGAKTVYVRFTDSAGNFVATAQAQHTIILDTTGPDGGVSVDPTNGDFPGYITESLVTLRLSAADVGSGPDKMRFSLDNMPGHWSDWENFETSKALFDITDPSLGGDSVDGLKYVYVQYRDSALNESSIFANSVILDTVAPAFPIVSITGSPTYINGPVVGLSVFASDANGIQKMQFSNSGLDGQWSDWEDFAATRAGWNLTDTAFGGVSEDGVKHIYARFRDAAGKVSDISPAASVVLDTTSPINPILTSPDHTALVWSTDNTVRVDWSGATDATSGVSGVAYKWSTMADDIPGYTPFIDGVSGSATSDVLADGNSWYFHLITKDNAGNWTSAAHAGPFYIDTTAPVGTISINSGHTYTKSSTVTLTLFASDAGGSGSYQMRISNDGVFDTEPWEAYGTTKLNWVLPASDIDGAKTVFAQYKDTAGNISTGIISYGITLDTAAPVDPNISSPSHSVSVWSTDNTVDINWSGATDAISGVSGVSYEWSQSSATVPDSTQDAAGATGSTTSRALVNGNSWYFHLRTRDNAGNWTSAIHFGPIWINNVPPVINHPSLLTPHNAFLASWGPMAFTWSAVPGATGYAIELIGSSGLRPSETNNSSPALNRIGAAVLPGGAALAYNGNTSGLVPGTTYWWRIIAIRNGQLFGVFSNAFSFVVSQPKPILTVPANAALPARGPLAFTWSTVDNATGYAIELCSANPGDTNNTVQAASRIAAAVLPGGSSTTYPGDTSNLIVGQTYWWRIIAIKNGQLFGVFSAPRSFTVDTASPILVSPSQGQVVLKNSPLTFKWTFTPAANDPAMEYAIELISSSGLALGEANNRAASINRIGAAILPSGTLFSYQGNTSGLTPNAIYWWRVIGVKNGELYGEFSDAFSFQVSH